MNESREQTNSDAIKRQEMKLSRHLKRFKSWYGEGDRVFSPQDVEDKIWGYKEEGDYGNETDRLYQSVAFMQDMNHKLFKGEATVEDMSETDIASYEVRA